MLIPRTIRSASTTFVAAVACLALATGCETSMSVRPLADGPLSAREYVEAVWTGNEVLFLGGDVEPCPQLVECAPPDPLPDAAAYNPDTDQWRSIASPNRLVGSAAVLNGQVYAMEWASPDVLVYDPSMDSWSLAATNDLHLERGHPLVVWDESLVFVVAGRDDARAVSVAAWDPDTSSVSTLPAVPLPPMFDVRLVSVSDKLIVLGSRTDAVGSDGPVFIEGAAYDGDDGWQILPPSNIQRPMNTGWVATDRYAASTDTFYSLGDSDGGAEYPSGGVLSTDDLAWGYLPKRPAPGGVLGPNFSVGERIITDDGLLFDPEFGTWIAMPTTDATGREGATLAWTGSEVIVWGGVTWGADGAEIHDDGVAITLPSR